MTRLFLASLTLASPLGAVRTREIYVAALSQPDDSAEWIELEENGCLFDWTDCGVKHSNAPHPKSYGADYPMRGIAHSKSSTPISSEGVAGVYVEASAEVQKRNAIALWPELSIGGKRKETPTLVKKSSPHPGSAYANLPLRGLGLEGERPAHNWSLTAAEKRELAARPLTYARAVA